MRHLKAFSGILQADAYNGYNELYDPSRAEGPITSALCWAHARRQFFELADIAANARRGKNAGAISPIALEAVKRIDTLFEIERGINGVAAAERLNIRKEQSARLLEALEAWLREQRGHLSRSASVAEPIDYMLKRWNRFAHFINDGRICLTNNAAERALRGFALGRKSWLFAGSDRGAERAAVMATLIMTAKLNEIDPQAWLADVLARIANLPQGRLMNCCHGIGAPMSELSHRIKQLDEELLALGEEAMLLEELDGFIAGLLVSTGRGISSVMGAQFSPLAGWRSAVRVIGNSILGWSAAPLRGCRSGGRLDERVGTDVFGNEIGVLAEAVARAFDLDNDGMVEEPVEQRSGDDGIAEHVAPFGKATV